MQRARHTRRQSHPNTGHLLDIHPTALNALGEDTEGQTEGDSLIDLANAPDARERLVAREYHAMGAPTSSFMLRRGDWKYHYYEGYAPELFNLSSDPEEENDLAAALEFKSVVDEFEATLRKRVDPAAVDRRAKDDMAALIEIYGGREKAIDLGRTGSTPVPGQAPE